VGMAEMLNQKLDLQNTEIFSVKPGGIYNDHGILESY
jgi:hypothetical protein